MSRRVWEESSLLRCAFSSRGGRYYEVFDPYRSPWSDGLDKEIERDCGRDHFLIFNKFLGQWALVFVNPTTFGLTIKGYYESETQIIPELQEGRWQLEHRELDGTVPDIAPTGDGVTDPDVQDEINKQVHDACVNQGVAEKTPSVVI